MDYLHEVQIFTNAALLTLTETFTIQKFLTLNSCNQHIMKIYGSFVVCIMQLATYHARSQSSSQFTILGHHGYKTLQLSGVYLL